MKESLSRWAITLLLCCISASLTAQEPDDDLLNFDIEGITLENVQETAFQKYWDEHFIGRAGLYYVHSIDWTRFSQYATLGYDDSWEKWSVNTELRFVNSNLNAVFETDLLENTEQENLNVGINTSEFEVRELFIGYKLTDSTELIYGKQTIVWGQGSYVSPIDFLLPPDFFSLKSDLSKKERRVPIEALQIKHFPIEKLEIQAYYFPKYTPTNLTPLTESIQDAIEEDPSLSIDDFIRTPNGRSDEAQYALRTMFYSNWGTFGITYYEG